MVLWFFEKALHFSWNIFQSWNIENVQNFQWLSHKNIPISQTEGYFKNSWYCFLGELMLFLLYLKWNL